MHRLVQSASFAKLVGDETLSPVSGSQYSDAISFSGLALVANGDVMWSSCYLQSVSDNMYSQYAFLWLPTVM